MIIFGLGEKGIKEKGREGFLRDNIRRDIKGRKKGRKILAENF